MNYEDMSDFEVNKIVAMAESLIINDDQSMSKRMKGSEVRVNDIVSSWWFDPCNNPSDAWPIIELIWGELMKPPYRGHGTTWERLIGEYSCGKLRAAMICFLKMKDAEK